MSRLHPSVRMNRRPIVGLKSPHSLPLARAGIGFDKPKLSYVVSSSKAFWKPR